MPSEHNLEWDHGMFNKIRNIHLSHCNTRNNPGSSPTFKVLIRIVIMGICNELHQHVPMEAHLIISTGSCTIQSGLVAYFSAVTGVFHRWWCQAFRLPFTPHPPTNTPHPTPPPPQFAGGVTVRISLGGHIHCLVSSLACVFTIGLDSWYQIYFSVCEGTSPKEGQWW